jgi:hypothetical protein
MTTARRSRSSFLILSFAVMFAFSHTPVSFAAPRAQDAPSVAIATVARTVDRAIAEVSGVAASQPAHSDVLAVEEDPEWQRLSSGDAEIWLPASFTGGNPEQDLDLIIDRVEALGPDFADVVDAIELNPSAFKMFAVDTENARSGFLTNVNVIVEQVLSFMTSEQYLDIVSGQLPAQYEVGSTESVELSQFEDAARMFASLDLPGSPSIAQVMYAIKDDSNNIWFVTFSTGQAELDELLPVFERSIESFSVLPE